MYRVIVWGTGNNYNHFYNSMKLQEMMGHIKVVAITSHNQFIKKSIDGYPFMSSKDAAMLDFDYCLVAVNDSNSVREEAKALNIPEEKLIDLRVFGYPNFDFNKYIAIKKSNISIISRNCWGGLCYHALNLEFLSPTINLFFEPEDYYMFVKNLDYYLSLPVEFSATGYVESRNAYYPIGRLDNIFIHFSHYTDFEFAKNCWEKRKKRINFDNLLIVTTAETREYAAKFLELPYEHKLVFLPPEIASDFQSLSHQFTILPERDHPDSVLYSPFARRDCIGTLADDKTINLLSLFSHEGNFVRIS